MNCALPLGLKTENRLRTFVIVNRDMILVLTAVLYNRYFIACFAKDKSVTNLHDVVLMRFVLHFLNEHFQWDRRIHRVGILTSVSNKVGHRTKAYPALAILLWVFLFSCVWGGEGGLFVLLPSRISLRNSRLATWPDSGLVGKGLGWELFNCKCPYERHLLEMREVMCQSSVGSFEILVSTASMLPV